MNEQNLLSYCQMLFGSTSLSAQMTIELVSGQLIYLGAEGTITGSAPTPPSHSVRLGQVVRDSPSNNGAIYVRVDNGYELRELHDVYDTSNGGSYGDLLVRSGSLWTNSKQLSGSYGLTGSLEATSFTGSLLGTASYAVFANTSSYAVNSTTSSYAINATTAQTASYADNFTVAGTLTAQTLVVQTVSSSIVYSSGSNRFGNDLTNTQSITGSASITGSLQVNGSNVILSNQTSSMSVATSSYVENAQTASYVLQAVSSSFATNALTASYASNVPETASYALVALTASYAANVPLTASYALSANTASYALTASYISGSGGGVGFPFSGSAVITGSLLVSQSFVDFTQATYVTGSFTGSFSGTVTTASYALFAANAPGTTTTMTQSVAATTWSFVHNLNTRNPLLQVYDSANRQVIPFDIVGDDPTTALIYFDTAESGYAVASNGGGLTVSGSTARLDQTSAAVTWSFAHNLATKYPNFIVYDANDDVVTPAGIHAVDFNNAEIYFSFPSTGKAIANFSGINGAANSVSSSYAETSSYSNNFTVGSTFTFDQTLTDYHTVASSIVGSNNIFTKATGSYTSAFFKYTVTSGSNARTGEVMTVWNGGSTQYSDVSTVDIGSTSAVTASAAIVTGQIQFNITTGTSGWRVKSIGTFM